MARRGLVRSGEVRHGLARFGEEANGLQFIFSSFLARLGRAGFGRVRHGPVGRGMAR